MPSGDERLAAEARRLRRSPHDPVRAAAAAALAGLTVDDAEVDAFAALVDRLEDDEGTAFLSGSPVPLARLAALVVADAIVRGASRILWVGPWPRSIDRVLGRGDLPLREVRPERGAYEGDGLFVVPGVALAPPGLGVAGPFDRVIATTAEDAVWKGPTLHLGVDTELAHRALSAPADTVGSPRHVPVARKPVALLDEPLHVLSPPPIGELARAAAQGSSAAALAVLRRLDTRLGRMLRAARSERTDDGLETAHQLAGDRGVALDPRVVAALEETALEPVPKEALEAERERVQRAVLDLERSSDPAIDALMAEVDAADGGVVVFVAAKAAREAIANARSTREVADAEDVDARIAAARTTGSLAVVTDAEALAARLDRAACAGVRTMRLADGGSTEAQVLIGGEAPPAIVARTSTRSPALEEAERRWAAWQTPEAGASEHRIAHLVSEEGARLLVVGPPHLDHDVWRTMDEARFRESLALLDTARVRLDRLLDLARRTLAETRAALSERRDVWEREHSRATRRVERAVGTEGRDEAARALATLDAEREALDEALDAAERAYAEARREALARFATPGRVQPVGTDEPARTSQVRGTL